MAPTDYFPMSASTTNNSTTAANTNMFSQDTLGYIMNLVNELDFDIPELPNVNKKRYERRINLYKKPQNYCARKTIIARPREIRSKAI